MEGIYNNTIICIQYSVISVVCTASLIYFIIVTNRSAEHSSELRFYKLTIGFAALCSLTDVMFALRQFGMLRLGETVNYISEILYSLGSICGAYCWFVYTEKKRQSRIASSGRIITLLAVPFAVMCLFTVTTPVHKLCFSLTGSQYVRGILNVPFTLVCSAFILYAGFCSGVSSFLKKYHSKAILLRLLFLYSVQMITAQLAQIYAGPILPFRSLAATVIMMFITLRGMCETVTIDALSGINNRFSFDRMMDSRISGGSGFWLIMLDIDDFKHINDTYGHIYGDTAIRCTASAIVRAIPHNYYAARYGGDEFAVVAPDDSEAVIEALEEKIRAELQEILIKKDCPFSLDITTGYTGWNENINNIPDMVEAADRILYERKRTKKQTHSKKQ